MSKFHLWFPRQGSTVTAPCPYVCPYAYYCYCPYPYGPCPYAYVVAPDRETVSQPRMSNMFKTTFIIFKMMKFSGKNRSFLLYLIL
jgi:hypothetical protein